MIKNAAALFVFMIFLIPLGAQLPGTKLPVGEYGIDYNALNGNKKREGLWIRVYSTNPKIMYYKGQFKNGVPFGIFEFYNEKGGLKSTVNHVQDTTVNDVVNYFSDGKTMMSKGRYVGVQLKGKPWERMKTGEWQYFNEEGKTIRIENLKNGVLEGVMKNYYPNGTLSHEHTYKGGLKNGAFTEYATNGALVKKGEYLNDAYHNLVTFYNQDGKKAYEGTYSNGVKKGTWRTYNESEQVEKEFVFEGDQQKSVRYGNGVFTEYHPETNIPKSEHKYINFKKSGPFKEWYLKGEFVEVELTPEEVNEGIAYKEQLVGTQLSRTGMYLNGVLHGEVQYYKLTGELEKIEVYEFGVLKSTR
jgi:antitoxin component YwqK of YwqJK toxin-antitoxin module